MASLIGKFSVDQITLKKLVLAVAIGILPPFHGTGVAQIVPDCVIQVPQPVVSPDPVDREAILNLIYRYNSALDNKILGNAAEQSFLDLFMNDFKYVACKAGGTISVFSTTNKRALAAHFDLLHRELDRLSLRTRRFTSNILLHAADRVNGNYETVEGITDLLVTIQPLYSGVPAFDYSAAVKATFKRDGSVWKFATLVLVTDTPQGFQTLGR